MTRPIPTDTIAAIATAPIAETLPPPETNVHPRSAMPSPTLRANSNRSGCVGPEAQ